MSKPSPLLQINKLQRPMFGPLSLAINAGECVCLSGPSGAGKSQLLRAIADLDPHDGEVLLAGESSGDIKPYLWRQRVGLLPPESSWWWPTAAGHFHNGLPVALEALGLPLDILGKPITRLSSGEKQRLALLRLLANAPRVLLLDEPTANLDPANTLRTEAVINAYRQSHGVAILWVSHDPEQMTRVADRRLQLSDGELQEQPA
ncbi:MAG: ATP-binding cassette domain-containing protein [Pseudomonadota bacterium]